MSLLGVWNLPILRRMIASESWGESLDRPAPSSSERHTCARERADADKRSKVVTEPFPIVDLEDEAKSVRYRHNNKVKRTRYRRVDLRQRRVVIVLHQMGVERSAGSQRWRRVTAHRVIGPDGTRMRIHPLNVRLVAGNRLDRAPYHAIHIEIAGNFEGVDGSGDWWAPDIYGRGRASEAQILATRQEIRGLCAEVAVEYGARVWAMMPHRVSGRDEDGDPNRPLCPGSRVWSQCGEWAGAVLELPIPSSGFSIGGTPVPTTWHGPYLSRCELFVSPEGGIVRRSSSATMRGLQA